MTTVNDEERHIDGQGRTIITRGGRTFVVMPDGLRRWTAESTREDVIAYGSPTEEFYDASWKLVRVCRSVGQGRSSRRECGTPQELNYNGRLTNEVLAGLFGTADRRDTITQRSEDTQAKKNMSENAATVDRMGNLIPNDRGTIIAKHVRMARVWGIGGPAAGIGLGFAMGGKTGAIVGGILGAVAGAWGYMDHMEQGEIASRPAEPMRVPTGGIPTMADVPAAKQPAQAKQPAPVVEKVQPGPVPVTTFLSPVTRPRVMLSRVASDAVVAGGSGRESSRADTMLRLFE